MVIRDPSLQRLVSIASALGSLRERVVFIGGAIAPILHSETVLPYSRPTHDVDAVLATHRYSDSADVGAELRSLGFHQRAIPTAHVHRWLSADGISFDLVPTGDHLGGIGGPWDDFTVNSSQRSFVDGVELRHASSVAFLVMKIAAFADRGGDDPRMSHDVEDIVALSASRGSLVVEVAHAENSARREVVNFTRSLVHSDAFDEILAAHLNNAIDPAEAERLARERFTEIAALR